MPEGNAERNIRWTETKLKVRRTWTVGGSGGERYLFPCFSLDSEILRLRSYHMTASVLELVRACTPGFHTQPPSPHLALATAAAQQHLRIAGVTLHHRGMLLSYCREKLLVAAALASSQRSRFSFSPAIASPSPPPQHSNSHSGSHATAATEYLGTYHWHS
ncbi:hypothetical protein BGW80DRAFT_871542 [Lactifluus volemus]|nr:hypothetical protein BGW80DRAFT_871542 [Lactifluus volemus]